MELVYKIVKPIAHMVEGISQSAFLCVFLGTCFALGTFIMLRFLTGELLAMHKSKNRVKKIKAGYSFWQRLTLRPAWDHCIHAPKFCKAMVVLHNFRCVWYLLCMGMMLLSGWNALFLTVCAWFVIIAGAVIDFPMLIFQLLLDRYPFVRMRHEYRFKKYHNTPDHRSLF